MRLMNSVLLVSALTTVPSFVLGIEVGQSAPACPMRSMAGGDSFNISKFQGKVVYLDFWSSWCSPCAQSLSFLNELQAELKGNGFEVVAVNLDENSKDAEGFLSAHPVKLTTVTAPEGQCPEMFGVQAMPSSYLIDRQGKVRHIHAGFRPTDKNEIRSQVEALLAEK